MNQSLWWLSYADDDGFRGVVITRADSFMAALRHSRSLGVSPGGQVEGFELPPEADTEIKTTDLDRCLTEEEISEYVPLAVAVRHWSSSETSPLMRVQITSSYSKGNAPGGYLIARVEIIPGLYAESERSPYTGGRWRWVSFRLGDADAPGRESKHLCEIEAIDCDVGIAGEIVEILNQVSQLYDSTFLLVDLRPGSEASA